MQRGKLVLIPSVISDNTQANVLSNAIIKACSTINYFAVENVRTSRRFISSLKLDRKIESLNFQVLNKDTPKQDLSFWIELLKNGDDVGLMSESGCPGIADPGSELVMAAHRIGVRVIPLVGPSSIFLSLSWI